MHLKVNWRPDTLSMLHPPGAEHQGRQNANNLLNDFNVCPLTRRQRRMSSNDSPQGVEPGLESLQSPAAAPSHSTQHG